MTSMKTWMWFEPVERSFWDVYTKKIWVTIDFQCLFCRVVCLAEFCAVPYVFLWRSWCTWCADFDGAASRHRHWGSIEDFFTEDGNKQLFIFNKGFRASCTTLHFTLASISHLFLSSFIPSFSSAFFSLSLKNKGSKKGSDAIEEPLLFPSSTCQLMFFKAS